jgi:type II secretory pathway pseudopilin PulG
MSQIATNRQGGFSLLEALLAAALILVITLGIMPLFTSSIVQNIAGKESTLSSNYSRSTSEEMISLPLDREVLRPPVSQISQEVCQDYEEGVGWEYVICGAPLVGEPKWTRDLSVQQYSIRDIYDADTANGVPTLTNPIPGYGLSDQQLDSFVHLREVMVVTEGQRAPNSPLGKARRVDIVNLRGF